MMKVESIATITQLIEFVFDILSKFLIMEGIIPDHRKTYHYTF